MESLTNVESLCRETEDDDAEDHSLSDRLCLQSTWLSVDPEDRAAISFAEASARASEIIDPEKLENVLSSAQFVFGRRLVLFRSSTSALDDTIPNERVGLGRLAKRLVLRLTREIAIPEFPTLNPFFAAQPTCQELRTAGTPRRVLRVQFGTCSFSSALKAEVFISTLTMRLTSNFRVNVLPQPGDAPSVASFELPSAQKEQMYLVARLCEPGKTSESRHLFGWAVLPLDPKAIDEAAEDTKVVDSMWIRTYRALARSLVDPLDSFLWRSPVFQATPMVGEWEVCLQPRRMGRVETPWDHELCYLVDASLRGNTPWPQYEYVHHAEATIGTCRLFKAHTLWSRAFVRAELRADDELDPS